MDKQISEGFSKGPVEILCDEIGAIFNSSMETIPVFLSFITTLVAEIEHDEIMNAKIRGSQIEEKLQQAFVDMDELLSATDYNQIMYLADQFCIHEQPKHLLRDCAITIKFGLERPCKSRHAADTAKRICRNLYGYSLHDIMISEFENQWVRNKFYDSLGRLAGEVRLEGCSASRSRNAGYPAPPAQTRTCGITASGSSVVLAFARAMTLCKHRMPMLLLRYPRTLYT